MLPTYVYDLVAAVQRFEDEHGCGHECFDDALLAIPAEERHAAAVLAAYKREQAAPADEARPRARRCRCALTPVIEPQEFTVGDRTYRGFPVPPFSHEDDAPAGEASAPGPTVSTCSFPGCLNPEHAAKAPHDALTDRIARAIAFNQQYQLGEPEAFHLHPDDADRFHVEHNTTVFAGGRPYVLMLDEAVPVGWLRVVTDGRWHDADLPSSLRKA